MSKKVYHLKRSTHREQARHMKNMMAFKAELREHQDTYEEELCPLCGGSMNGRPLWMVGKYSMCYSCLENAKQAAHAELSPIDYDLPDPIDAAESARIDRWLSDSWDFIPEIPFGEAL